MSCDMEMAANSNDKVPSSQHQAPACGALITNEGSLGSESALGEVAGLLETIQHLSFDNGDQGQCPLRHRSNSCSSNTDDQLDLKAVSDTLPSEVSPANLGEDFGKHMEMILSSHMTNTATKVGDGLQSKHTRNPSTNSFNSPWGADSPWGLYKIPEEFDKYGHMTRWTTATVQKVKPYIQQGRQGQKGGSGILDTEDPTHYYLTMPLGSLDTSREVPEEIEEQRRVFSEATYIEPLAQGDHTGFTDVESSDEDSDEGDTEPEQENDFNIDNSEGAIVPVGLTYGGLWNNTGTRDVRESRSSPDIIYTHICTDDTGSVFSWADDESDPDGADLQALKFLKKSEDQCDTEIEDMQAHSVCNRIFVTTADGGTVRIDLPRVIVVSYPGKPTKELPFSIANLSKTCWDIIKDHGIAHVRAINANTGTEKLNPVTIAKELRSRLQLDTSTSSSPVFDSVWIQTNATFAMKEYFPVIEYYLDIQATCDGNRDAIAPDYISFLYYSLSDLPAHYLLNKPLAPPNGTLEEEMADGTIVSVDESNLTIPQFIKRLYIESKIRAQQIRSVIAVVGPNVRVVPSTVRVIEDAAALVDDWPVEERVLVPKTFNHDNGYYDLQHFDWLDRVGLSPDEVREERDAGYVEYRNTDTEVSHDDPMLAETPNIARFVPKAMYTKYKASAPHKQLRNLMACKGYNAVVYASDRGVDRSKVFHYHPFHDTRECIIDLSKTSNDTVYAEPVRISTVALSTGDYYRGICMAGGFDGEYALRNMLHDAEDRSVVVGHATRASYGIINHIDIDYFAHGNQYRAVMACNDNKIRVLDVETNTFLGDPGCNTDAAVRSGELSGHPYPWPVNCTAMCPHGKLRVVVGDTTDVSVVNAESGACERILKGHDDYGFACAWSPDGWYIATANQDRLVKIWDTRTWRAVTEFAAEVAGYRSMRFSPVGGGSKCLLLAEPADRVCVVNATNYEQMQTHEFYGEIVGMDFHADGTGFWVANADEKFGGMMEYERRGYGMPFGFGFLNRRAIEDAGGEYREQGANEWVWERERGNDPRVVDPTRSGPAGNWVSNDLC